MCDNKRRSLAKFLTPSRWITASFIHRALPGCHTLTDNHAGAKGLEIDRLQPEKNNYSLIIQECGNLQNLTEGKLIHAHSIRNGINIDAFINNLLIVMYGKCGSLHDAIVTFDRIQKRNIVSWNAMIAAYSYYGYTKYILDLLRHMPLLGVKWSKVSFITALNSCTSQVLLTAGILIHAFVVINGLESDMVLGNALLHVYGRWGSLEDAHKMFLRLIKQDVVSWNCMIAGYARHENGKMALQLFRQMQEYGHMPNKITCITVLSACSHVRIMASGKLIHAYILKLDMQLETAVGNALICMYSKCDNLKEAIQAFDCVPKDIISWNGMIAALVQHGNYPNALQWFFLMQETGVQVDKVTFLSILDACANLAVLEEGRVVHACIINIGIHVDFLIGIALLNMYGKCGSLQDSCNAFDRIPERNVVSWSALVTAHAQHGQCKKAIWIFQQMQLQGINPNDVTLTSILSACSHAGLVDEGCHQFISMDITYGITPLTEHYGCIVDMFGRDGWVDGAVDFISGMPLELSSVGWTSFLNACRMCGDMERGNHAATYIMDLEPQNASSYMLLSDMYALPQAQMPLLQS